MKKAIIAIFIIVVLGVGYWLISPLFINKEVSETLEDIVKEGLMQETAEQQQPQIIAKGTFTGLAGHKGEGTATLLKIGEGYYVRFEEDFETTNGPDLFVYLGKDGAYAPEARLASLKGNVGSQNYEIPASIDVRQYDEVWVWCRAFSVPFAKAILQ